MRVAFSYLFLAAYLAHGKGYVSLVKKVQPSVVNIAVVKLIRDHGEIEERLISLLDSPHKDYFGSNLVNAPRRVGALGSGFVIDKRGYIVTNYHIVSHAAEIKVVLADETVLSADIVGVDPGTDLALIKVTTPKNLQALEWGDSDKAEVGEEVISVGNPHGFGGSVTAGIISAKSRRLSSVPRGINSHHFVGGYIQSDASTNHGNSGGPMINRNGKVIGVTSIFLSQNDSGSIGLGFSIPSNLARTITEKMMTSKRVKRSWVGVMGQSVSNEIASVLKRKTTKGFLVSSVATASPARKSGLKPGDIIVQLHTHPIDDAKDFARFAGDLPIDISVPVVVWRDGKEHRLTIYPSTLKDHDAFEGMERDLEHDYLYIPELGMGVVPLAPQFKQRFGVSDDAVQGLAVVGVKEGSVAEKYAFTIGDIIVALNQQPVTTSTALSSVLSEHKGCSPEKPLLFYIYREGTYYFMGVDMQVNNKLSYGYKKVA